MSDSISLVGLVRPRVFAALFNGAKPLGLGFLQYNPEPMTAEQAQERFGECSQYFDYVDGRVMKVDLSGDEFRTGLYNRDNGVGAAEAIINLLQSTGEVYPEEVELHHLESTRDSAIYTKEHLADDSIVIQSGGAVKFILGLSDVADDLKPALDDILGDD